MKRSALHDWFRHYGRRRLQMPRRRRRDRRELKLETLEPRQMLTVQGLPCVEFETELTSLDLVGGPFPMPLASDPGNALGDSIDGFGFVDSVVTVTLSSQRIVDPGPPSLGMAVAFPAGGAAAAPTQQQPAGPSDPINPEEFDGQPFVVESFFDVFYDITITDVDHRPGRDFATGTPSITLQDIGPAFMQSFAGEREPLLFDKDAPNFGLVPPPEDAPYIGHFDIVIDLSAVFGQTVDINMNGDPDLLKFTLATHSVGDENRTFIELPDGTTADTFDSAAVLDGAILDSMDDPPFQIGMIDPATGLPDPNSFGGPTTATSTLLNPIIEQDDFAYGLAEIELIHPDTTREIIKLAGSNTVLVTFEDAEGDAIDNDGNNLDEVDTEMVALSLRGNSSLGPVEVRLNPAMPTLGQIEELVDNNTGTLDVDPFAPGDADSFFDVFFEIEVGGQVLHNNDPKRMSAVITEKPPTSGDIYESPVEIDLFDVNEMPTGFSLGFSRHEPNPPIEVDVFETSLAQLVLDVAGNQRNATLTGPTTVHVNIPPDGTAVDTDGDGLDQVPAEMVQLDLTGISDFGPISVTLNPNRRTLGEIEETANNTPNVLDVDPFAPGTADSFFDVFFEVHVGGQVLHNETPVRMASTITHKPPAMGDIYQGISGPVVLFDEMNNPTNFVLVQEIHIPDPGEVDRFDNTVAEVVLEHPDLSTERITLVGPTIVVVDIPPDGSADDSDGNNRDDVDTELVDMFLRGNSSLGPVIVKQSRDLSTFGVIEETVDNNTGLLDVDPFAPGDADSFFDVFFDFEVPSIGVFLHNEDPASLQATITNKPPGHGDRYFFNTPIQLLDQAGNPTGFSILQEIHNPNPPIEVDEFPVGVGDILLEMPDGSTEQISLVGTATANVFFDGAAEGDASDDDGNGLDEVPTQLVELNLQGSSSLGPVTVRLNNGVPTLGQIEEKVNNNPGLLDVDPFAPGNADSFFDVFFEIEVGGQTIFNLDPARIETTITEKPPGPGDTYRNPFSAPPLELFRFDEGLGQLVSAGFLLRERHTPVTTVEMDPFVDTVGQILIEIGPQQNITTPDPNLPPSHGDYRTAADVHATYDGGALLVELQRIEHRAFADTAIRTPSGPDEIESFDSSLRGTAIIDGDVFPVELTGPVQVISFGKVGNTTGTFDTEILSMDLTGVIPGGPIVVIRESPGQASQGQTTITDIGGGHFQIDSFFDVFTEVSIDGGPFIPSTGSTRVDLVESGVEQPTPDLPPNDGVYRTAADVHAEFSGPDLDIVLQDVAHQRFANVQRTQNPSDPPNSERETFDSTLTGIATFNSLDFSGTVPFTLTGQVETVVQDKAVRDTGTFQTEILSMDLSGTIPGGPAIMLRESPTQQSTGTTRITDLGGTFNVDSFFDIWTEVSIDGGQTWIPSSGPTPVELSPPREHITVIGDSQANVHFEGRAEGDATDDNFNGLDEVETELVQLDLTGNSSLGPVQVRLHPGTRSVGRIEELVNDNPGLLDVDPFAPGNADSFFDVFVEIEVGGQVLHTPVATRLQTVIDDKPPEDGERYIFDPPRPLELLDAAGNRTGIFIVREIHDPVTEIEEDEFNLSVVELELIHPDASTEMVRLIGPAKVNVHFEGAAEGDASDDNGNSLDEVVTEMVQLDLTGTSSLGPVTVRLDATQRSIGQIEELVNNNPGLLDVDPFAPGDADSFFDVFFEIEIGGQVLHGAAAKRMATVITNKPPGVNDIYVGVDVVDLLDANGLPTGFAIGTAQHDPNGCSLVVTHTGDSGSGSLRNAILCANEHPGVDTISFNIPGMGVHTIAPLTNLPAITDQAIVDATTQPGFPGTPLIQIDGHPNLGQSGIGFEIGSNADGTIIRGFNIIGMFNNGIFVSRADNTQIEGNFIGTSPDGTMADPMGGNNVGVLIVNGAGNTIGGNTLAQRNLIGGNLIGVSVVGRNATNNTVAGNFVGVDITGAASVFNTNTGVEIGGAPGNTIGGATQADGNVISTNETGLDIRGNQATGNTVQNNLIGTDATGAAPLGNTEDGVVIRNGASSTVVDGNVISANLRDGVNIARSSLNTLTGNAIGTDAAGTIATLGNRRDGVEIRGSGNSPNNVVGGTTMADGNVISGNMHYGVKIKANNNRVQGNRIGTNLVGSAAIGNGRAGVLITGASNNALGGANSGAMPPGNQIAGNQGGTGEGVLIIGHSSNNLVQGNLIGVDASGTSAIGNLIGIRITTSGTGNLIGGDATAGEGNLISGNVGNGVAVRKANSVNVFGNRIGTNLSGSGPVGNGAAGVEVFGSLNTNVGGTGQGQGNLISGNAAAGVKIASGGVAVNANKIGTDAAGTTAVPNLDGVLITGAGNTIGGDSTAGEGNLISGNTGAGILIQGVTATGNVVQGNLIGVRLDGTTVLKNKYGIFVVDDASINIIGGPGPGDGNTISGNSLHGVYLKGSGTTGNQVQGNQIGTNLAGDSSVANFHGVTIDNAPNNTIGGTAPAAGNVISGNDGHGVRLLSAGASGNFVAGNMIGTDATGTTAIPNTNGVFVGKNAHDNTIPINNITNNRGTGVFVTINAGTGNQVSQNSIHDNGGLGIDLGGRGRTANDPGDPDTGGNNLQNFPVIQAVSENGANLDVTLLVDSAVGNAAYDLVIELFVGDADNQEGETFLDSVLYPSAGAGIPHTFVISKGPATVGSPIVATATDDDGNTSEFSAPAIVTSMLQAAGGEASQASRVEGQELVLDELLPIVDAAVSRLAGLGLDASLLSSVDVSIADLPGAALGAATANSITLDVNAASHGWFVDATPLDDSEFTNRKSKIANQKSIDLLTAVMHELSHVAGLDDLFDAAAEDDLMFGWLGQGVRKTSIEASLADKVFGGSE